MGLVHMNLLFGRKPILLWGFSKKTELPSFPFRTNTGISADPEPFVSSKSTYEAPKPPWLSFFPISQFSPSYLLRSGANSSQLI